MMQMIDVCRKETAVEPVLDFDAVRSFDDMCQANLKYLLGHLFYTPTHFGPLATETDVIKDWLVRLFWLVQ